MGNRWHAATEEQRKREDGGDGGEASTISTDERERAAGGGSHGRDLFFGPGRNESPTNFVKKFNRAKVCPVLSEVVRLSSCVCPVASGRVRLCPVVSGYNWTTGQDVRLKKNMPNWLGEPRQV